MSSKISEEQLVMLYIRAKKAEMKRNPDIKQELSIEEVAQKTGVNINKIKGMIISEDIMVKKGIVNVVEKSDKEKRNDVIKYVEENPGVYIFKIPIELVGIDIEFVNKMIGTGELKLQNGKVTVNTISDLQSKFKRLKLALALFPKNRALKYELSSHTGIEIYEIDQMILKHLFIEDSDGYIKENTAIERNNFKKQLQVDEKKRKDIIDERRLNLREGLKKLEESKKNEFYR